MSIHYQNSVTGMNARGSRELNVNVEFHLKGSASPLSEQTSLSLMGRTSAPGLKAPPLAAAIVTDSNPALNSNLTSDVYDVAIQPTTDTPAAESPKDWFSQSLADRTLANLTRSLDSDGSLSRTDMIKLFRTTETDGVVSGTELTDLRTIVQSGEALGMAGYVRVLSDKIVNGSLANATFQGQALGNLYAGSSADQMEALVEKHFYGADVPADVIPGTGGDADRYITYGYAKGSLFGTDGAPSITDIHQGALGDCYFLSSLGATAVQNPFAIENMFLDNGDGTFTVRFFSEQNGTVGAADYVTVNRLLPTDVTTGDRSGGHFALYDNEETGLWVALAEKAYAQFAEEGFSQRPADAQTGLIANSYGSIEGGWGARTMPSITGATGYIFADNADYGTVGHYGGTMLSLSDIAAVLQAGCSLVADTAGDSDTHLDPNTGMVLNHEYVIVNADTNSGMLTLYNPWGDSREDTGDISGFKFIAYADFLNDVVDIGAVQSYSVS